MSYLNALMNPGQIGQGVQQSFLAGREFRADNETRNALASLVTNPNDTAAMTTLAQYNPQAAMQMQERQRQMAAQQAEEAAKQRQAELQGRFLDGDEEAGDELAKMNLDVWIKADGAMKARAKDEATMFGQAALDVLQAPPETRQQRILAYAQAMPEFADQISALASLPPDQQELQLRTVIANARMVEKLHALEKPQTLNVQPGAGVYERDPITGEISTVIQPNYGGAPAFSPVGSEQPPAQQPNITNEAAGSIMGRAKQAGMIMPEDYQALANGLAPRGKAAMDLWLQDNGIKVVKRTGTAPDGRKVVELADGTIEYAAN